MYLLRLILKNALRHELRTTLTVMGIVVAISAFGLLRTIVDAWYAGANASFCAPRDLDGAIRANVAVERGVIDIDLGFVGRKPRDVFFRRELDAEIARMASFLGVSDGGGAAR